ncbi:MAG: tol-pal system protein YbgF, partial [Wenzhouxiangellaceae bacterium]
LDRRLGELRSGGAGLNQAPVPGSRDNGPGSRQDSPEDNRAGSRDQMASGGTPTNRPEAAEPPDTRQMELPEVRAPQTEQPEVVTLADPGSGEERQLREPTQAEQQAYDQAFRALRETRYADAAEGFDAFLRDHPESSYAPNALYWLGEVYYVTRDFKTALAQFERLQSTYPDSGKKADALLKIGFSHYELGNWDRARAALEQVISDFPGTNYSRLAENRLRTMRLEGNL